MEVISQTPLDAKSFTPDEAGFSSPAEARLGEEERLSVLRDAGELEERLSRFADTSAPGERNLLGYFMPGNGYHESLRCRLLDRLELPKDIEGDDDGSDQRFELPDRGVAVIAKVTRGVFNDDITREIDTISGIWYELERL